LSISVIRTVVTFLILSCVSVAIDRVYGIFGHGVTSPAMIWMFLYPLLGGAVIYTLLYKLRPELFALPKFRRFYNLYNSGIAALTIGSFLLGIFQIAGTSSPFTIIFFIIGVLMIVVGVLSLRISLWKSRTNR
jgi:hypothetical protein